MRSTRHDPSQAVLQAGAGLPGHVLDVVALTADPSLLATLRDGAGPEHAIWHAPSADTAVDLLVGGRCSILVADLDSLRGDAAALLEQLHAQFPELILLATGRRDEEHAVAALVGSGKIYRFLHKPISLGRAHVFLAAATRRYGELRSHPPLAIATVETIAARTGVRKIVAAAVAVTVATGVAIFLGLNQRSTSSSPPASATARAEQIADLLARGQMAIASGRILEPSGDNALEHFRAALSLQPDNIHAQIGMERVGAVLEAQLVEALQARDPARGRIALQALQRAQPNHPRLDRLWADLLALSRSTPPSPISVAPAKGKPPRTSAASQ